MKFYYVILFFILIIFNSTSYSQEAKKEELKKPTILDFKEELNLNEKQVKDIEKLLKDFKSKEAINVKKIQEHDRKLRELLQSEVDINEIKKEVREIYRLRGEIVADELETARMIDAFLTPEQKKKWKEIRLKGLKKNN